MIADHLPANRLCLLLDCIATDPTRIDDWSGTPLRLRLGNVPMGDALAYIPKTAAAVDCIEVANWRVAPKCTSLEANSCEAVVNIDRCSPLCPTEETADAPN